MTKIFYMIILVTVITACVLVACQNFLGASGDFEDREKLKATGHYKSVILSWEFGSEKDVGNFLGYNIYFSTSSNGTFVKVNTSEITTNLYFHWTDNNNQTYYYKLKAKTALYEFDLYDVVSATTHTESDEELLTTIQETTFRYFYDGAHSTCGFAYERLPSYDEVCTFGGTGFGLMALVVGVERGFISREDAAERVHKILSFAKNSVDRYHGAFSHWINGATGKTKPFDVGMYSGDLVETSYFIQGALAVHQYFNKTNSTEKKIRTIVKQLWEEVEWDWYLTNNSGGNNPIFNRLAWNWAENGGWYNELYISGFNECMITYLLAIASPTYTISSDCYVDAWAGWNGGTANYTDPASYYTYNQYVSFQSIQGIMGMRLFWTHYSYLGFDPRGKKDSLIGASDYFEVFKNISLIDYNYCQDAGGGGYNAYSSDLWGLTSSYDPIDAGGYREHSPTEDNGTIAPTAALSAMPYTPAQSIAAARLFFETYGENLWGEYGFKDAFNLGESPDWYSSGYLAIDQGPIIVMIENYRTGLLWDLFMSHPDIQNLLTILATNGWTIN